MRWRILGTLDVADGDGVDVPRARKQQVLLGALLLHANRPVSTGLLTECLWDERPPRSARANLHAYVTQLRRSLHDVDATRLSTTTDGYQLRVAPGELDAEEFERLAADGQRASDAGDPARAADGFGTALRLWRGDVLAGTELPAVLRPAAVRLQELRLVVTEDHVEARLLGDRPAALVAELLSLTEAHPLRERFQAQLMLALHRAGRSPEALTAFRRFRRRLVEEMGVEPGEAVSRLHRRILGDDPILRAVQSRTAPVERPPRTLPPDVAELVGRDALLQDMDRTSGGVLVLSGIAGTGKTALAVHWAHRATARFPDGQLYLNLRGWSAGNPMPTLTALTYCLRALGVPAGQIPVDLDETVALYRTRLAGRRVLLILDNARTAEQIRPLLPGDGACVTVVTSRDRLTGLVAVNHARRLTIAPLHHDDAVALLRSALHHQNRDDLARLADACGRLPLALRIAAAKCADQPEQDLAAYVAALATHGGLAELSVDGDPEASVRAAFAISYRLLPPSLQRLFRLIGLVPGPDVTRDVAAALLGDETAGDAVDGLCAVHLLEPRAGGRFTQHDLLRDYAREECERVDPAPRRTEAVGRLCDLYLAGVEGAAQVLYGHTIRLPSDVPARAFAEADVAGRWLDAELPTLVALIHHTAHHGPGRAAWSLADGLRGYFWIRRPMADWLATADDGLLAATADDDPHGLTAMRLSLGQAQRSIGHPTAADEHLAAALAASQRAGWPEARASILGHLAVAHAERGDNPRAAELLHEVRDLHRGLGRPANEATAVANLGALRYQLGDLRQSCVDMRTALALYRATGNRTGEALALANLGITHVYLGEDQRAAAYLDDGLTRYEHLGDPVGQAQALYGLAKLHSEHGDLDGAARHAATAAALADRAGDTGLHVICTVELALAHGTGAVARCAESRDQARSAGAAYAEVWALVGLARAALSHGLPDTGLPAAREALVLARRRTYRLLEGEAQRALAELSQDLVAARAAVALLENCGYRRKARDARDLVDKLSV